MAGLEEGLSLAQQRHIRKLKNPLAEFRKEQQELEKPARQKRGGMHMGSAALRNPRKKKGKYYAA